MKATFLDFEQPIAELESKIEELRFVQDDSAVDISEEIARLETKSQALTKEIYAKLTPWQSALVARHPQRPHLFDYLEHLITDFVELKGDRQFGDDQAIVGGLGGLALGSLIGGGTGRDVAMAAGAIGGAFAGNEVQKDMDKPQPGEQVMVRLKSGVLVSITQPVSNVLQPGEAVFVEGSGTDARVVPQQ